MQKHVSRLSSLSSFLNRIVFFNTTLVNMQRAYVCNLDHHLFALKMSLMYDNICERLNRLDSLEFDNSPPCG